MEIDELKVKRMFGHLQKLERMTDRPMRISPRYPDVQNMCPMVQFAPDEDRDRYSFDVATGDGQVFYYLAAFNEENELTDFVRNSYPIYEHEDSEWWDRLTWDDCGYYLNALQDIISKAKGE